MQAGGCFFSSRLLAPAWEFQNLIDRKNRKSSVDMMLSDGKKCYGLRNNIGTIREMTRSHCGG
jgi:hypothetical protein